MSGSYVQCPECGKRALSIATRCPHCSHEFSRIPEPVPPLEPRRPLRVLAVAGAAVLIALVLSVGWWIRRTPSEQGQPIAAIAPDTVAESTSVVEPDSVTAAAPTQRRFARTWTKVRTGRSTSADIAAILLPGDTVFVDSLKRGWWRVTFEGKMIGYVHRSTVQAEGAR